MSDADFRYCPRCGSHSGIRRRAGHLLQRCALCGLNLTAIIAAFDVATATSKGGGEQADSKGLDTNHENIR